MEYVLQTNALKKSYRHCRALSGLTMNVPKGAIYGLVGRNGAGKTTLIRLICGLQRPDGGTYTLYGRKNTDADIAFSRRRMGAVVETPSIYGDMTAEENIRQQYRILGLPSFDGVRDILQTVGLQDAGGKKAKHFSLGMRQRLGIGVALAGDPDFLVLDEPANGLDPQGIIDIRELILKLNRERQITVLVSSHMLEELSKFATHYGFLDGGCLVREISAAQLEAACRKCVRAQVSDVGALARVLDRMGVEYTVLSDREADVYARVGVSRLVAELEKEGCEVISLQERDESLESYYVNLMRPDPELSKEERKAGADAAGGRRKEGANAAGRRRKEGADAAGRRRKAGADAAADRRKGGGHA